MSAPAGTLTIRDFDAEVRQLKAVVTFVIYGMLFLLLKTLYESAIDLPEADVPFLLVALSFLLVMIVLLFNRFSRRAIERITAYATRRRPTRPSPTSWPTCRTNCARR
jgi:hypothetical protein